MASGRLAWILYGCLLNGVESVDAAGGVSCWTTAAEWRMYRSRGQGRRSCSPPSRYATVAEVAGAGDINIAHAHRSCILSASLIQ